MNSQLFYGYELLSTSMAAFCAAINLCVGLMAWDPVNSKRSYNIIFLFFCLCSAYFCLGEGLVYSGFFRSAVFFVPSPILAGYSFPGAILVMKVWFNPEFKIESKHLFLFLLGVPGTIYAIMSFFLHPTIAQALGEGFVQSDLSPVFATYAHPKDPDSAYFMLCMRFGFIHVLAMIIGTSIATLLTLQKFMEGLKTRDFKVLSGTLSLLAAGGIAIFMSAIVPVFLPGWQITRFAPISTVPLSFMLYRALLVRRKFYLGLNEERSLLSRYLPSNLVEDILKRKQMGTIGGTESTGTIMFCDIRNFTGFSEQVPAQQLIAELNGYLSAMNKVIHRHKGIINKYIGDEIMVIFGLDEPLAVGAVTAVECAQDMLRTLEDFNTQNKSQGRAVFRIGIGIHSGRLVHGNIGDAERMEYTVLGDTVNAAARIAGLTSQHNQALLCSSEIHRHLGQKSDSLKFFGEFTLRGRSSVTQIYGLAQTREPYPPFEGLAS